MKDIEQGSELAAQLEYIGTEMQLPATLVGTKMMEACIVRSLRRCQGGGLLCLHNKVELGQS